MAGIKSILIIGGSGFIGTHLALKLRQGYSKVFATYYSHPIRIPGVTFLPCNLENRNWVKRIVYTTQPDVVIYLAGNNDIQWSEKNVRTTELLHSAGPATLSNFTEILQPRFIFLSNSYVFDGSRGNYHVNDTVLPGSILGRMKLGGENIIRNKSLNYIILRSSPLFGRGNGKNLNFLDHLRIRLEKNQRIEVASDELHSYTPVDGFCDVIQLLIDSGIRNRTLHYGGLTKVFYFEFARKFAQRFSYSPHLILKKSRISEKGLSEEESFKDFSLNSTQTAELLKIKPLLLEESFDLIEKNLIPRL